MPIPKPHNMQIVKNEPQAYPTADSRAVGDSPYKFKLICSCQFEALAITENDARLYARGHAFRHGAADPFPPTNGTEVQSS